MLPLGLKITMSGITFFVGVLAGVEFIRAGQRWAKSYRAGINEETSSQKRTRNLLVVGISILIGVIGIPVLARLPEFGLYMMALSGGMVVSIIAGIALGRLKSTEE